jgi:hypothetical protein
MESLFVRMKFIFILSYFIVYFSFYQPDSKTYFKRIEDFFQLFRIVR